MPTLIPAAQLLPGDLLYLNRRALRVRDSFHDRGHDQHGPLAAVVLSVGGRQLRLKPTSTVPVISRPSRPSTD